MKKNTGIEMNNASSINLSTSINMYNARDLYTPRVNSYEPIQQVYSSVKVDNYDGNTCKKDPSNNLYDHRSLFEKPNSFKKSHKFRNLYRYQKLPYDVEISRLNKTNCPYERLQTSPIQQPVPPSGSSQVAEVPSADPLVLQVIQNDPTGFINVLGNLKEIRFYGEKAIVMMDWDDPRDISFLPCSRRVVIDDRDIFFLSLNEQYTNYTFPGGFTARIRLGAPTRDFFIEGRFIDAKFGGPPVEVYLGGSKHKIQLGGPNPQVCVGTRRRNDIVAGRVNLIIDENFNNIFHIYLDSKPQRFEISGIPFILKFLDSLKTVHINGRSFKIEFGGLPMPISVCGEIHLLRLSSLPDGLIPGFVNIVDMENTLYEPIVKSPYPFRLSTNFQTDALFTLPKFSADYNNYHYHYHYHCGPMVNNDSRLLPGPSKIARSSMTKSVIDIQSRKNKISSTNSVDVLHLYQKLVEKGLIQPPEKGNARNSKNETATPLVDFSKPQTLKHKNMRFVCELYNGAQCHICTMRFMRRDGEFESHLDWHYQVKRHKQTRLTKWWSHLSEFPLSEQNMNQTTWFGLQIHPETFRKLRKHTVPAKEFGVIPTCSVCLEGFIQFYDQEKEEWLLQNAIIANKKLCHPVCYQDQKVENIFRRINPEAEMERVLPNEVITIPDDSPSTGPTPGDDSEINLDQQPKVDNELSTNAPCNDLLTNDSNNDSFSYFRHEQGSDSVGNESLRNLSENKKILSSCGNAELSGVVVDSEKDILEIVEIKPDIETIDLSEEDKEGHFDDSNATNSSLHIAAAENIDASPNEAVSNAGWNATLDGNTHYMPPLAVRTNPIRINISSKLTPLKEEDKAYEECGCHIELIPSTIKPKLETANMTSQIEKVGGKDFSVLCSVM